MKKDCFCSNGKKLELGQNSFLSLCKNCPIMNKDSKIYVAGHTGLVGSAIVKALKNSSYTNLVFSSRPEYDLRNREAAKKFFEIHKPEYVFLSAAKVGGIAANNTYRADFIYDNLQIQNNVIQLSHQYKVKKLIFLGSSCIYPKESPQPIKEKYLLTGELEYTNEPYAIAKIAGIKLCESYNLQYGTNFIAVMPTNLYGQNDNYDLEKSHVLPALIRKLHLAKCLSENDYTAIAKDADKRPIKGINANSSETEIRDRLGNYGIEKDKLTIWGTGRPRREFLHADDLGRALVLLAEKTDFEDLLKKDYGISKPSYPLTNKEVRNTHINLGTGKDISILELAELIRSIVGFEGKIETNPQMPDGTFRKLLDVSKAKSYGIEAQISLKDGLKRTYREYLNREE
jgi:GDP-L-fucose synthase